MQAIDLHVHSNRSDGTLSPTQLVDYAMEKGLSAFALTDHDTIDGLDEAMSYAASLKSAAAGPSAFPDIRPGGADPVSCGLEDIYHTGMDVGRRAPNPRGPADTQAYGRLQNRNVPEVIPGIEFSTEYQGQDVHILGLYIDYKDGAFCRQLQDFVDSRTGRNRKMCLLLQQHGIHVSYEELQAEFPGSVLTRAHYAKYMLGRGYVKSIPEAFERYIGDHCPCFIPREKVTPVQAVELVLKAGGVPILAHPVLYHMSASRLEALTKELKEHGLAGLEAVYSTYTAAEERDMRRLASQYGLLVSGGSDFHGATKPGLELGTGYGKLFVPCSLLDDIRKAADCPG